MQKIKVRFLTSIGYVYQTNIPVKVGDKVVVPSGKTNVHSEATVIKINVLDSEIPRCIIGHIKQVIKISKRRKSNEYSLFHLSGLR